FRALENEHAGAFQARLRAAMTASGIDRALKFRHLFIIRRAPIGSGRVTERLVNEFTDAGGRFIAPSDGDLRTSIPCKLFCIRVPMDSIPGSVPDGLFVLENSLGQLGSARARVMRPPAGKILKRTTPRFSMGNPSGSRSPVKSSCQSGHPLLPTKVPDPYI